MAKKIVLETCANCPHRDHRGGYGAISCVPICRAVGKELPYRLADNPSRAHAIPTHVIPDWCPLENNDASEA